MLYSVHIKADTWYPNIEADSEEEAIYKALDFFLDYEPDIYVEKQEEEI